MCKLLLLVKSLDFKCSQELYLQTQMLTNTRVKLTSEMKSDD